MRRFIAAAFFALALAGCSTTQTPETGAAVEERAPGAGQAGAGASTAGAGGGVPSGTPGAGGAGAQAGAGAGRGVNPLRDPSSPLSKRSVFFDYDSFVVRDEFRPLLQAHGRYLADNRSARMRVEGNTDERGSREYNIALGQRRADAVRRMLQAMGAVESQIETVSLGKEKPRNPGHDEAAWAENRRTDMVYQGE